MTTGTQPLAFSFAMTPQIGVATVVTGAQRDVAHVQFTCENVVVYERVLTIPQPSYAFQADFPCAGAAIEKNAQVTLIWSEQSGAVRFTGKLVQGVGPAAPFDLLVAGWPVGGAT